MSETEIIVSMDKHIKIKGGHYKRDLIRCGGCKYYEPINNDDYGFCKQGVFDIAYLDDFCSLGEEP